MPWLRSIWPPPKTVHWIFSTKEIAAEVNACARDGEEAQGEDDQASVEEVKRISTDRVGRILAKMRLKQEPRHRNRGSRRWKIPLTELKRWTLRYRVEFPTELLTLENNREPQSTAQAHPSAASGASGASGTGGTETEPSERCPDCGEQDWSDWFNGRRICMSCLRQGA
jgi:hypothetical protein